MTYIEILANFEVEINKIDDAVNKPATDDSLFWLNQAVSKFIKLRFNGDFTHGTGYEETEKRREDLISLFKSVSLNITKSEETNPSYDKYTVNYPNDLMFVLDENVIISDMSNKNKFNTCVFECTRDSFMYRINNSLTDFHYKYHRARPLRIRHDEGCDLLTDKNYKISSYTLGYIKKPTEITLDIPTNEYPDFNDHIMYEIIKMAAQMYIENQGDPRYKTIASEVMTQE